MNASERIIRDIDINPPVLFKDDNSLMRRVTRENNCIDSVRHNKDMIAVSRYASSLQRVITLDSYSDSFLFYNSECSVVHRISP